MSNKRAPGRSLEEYVRQVLEEKENHVNA